MWKKPSPRNDLNSPDRPPLDRGRVRRAMDLHVEQTAPGQYYVRGLDDEDEYVEIQPHFQCHCGDAVFRQDVICKHIIAALLAVKDEEAVMIAREILREELGD